MADHGRVEPDEPAETSPDPHDAASHDDRDPVALAAWRRVAAQRGRRARGAGPEDDRDEPGSDPTTVEVPAPGNGAGAGGLPGSGDRWTASRPPPGFVGGARPPRAGRPDGPYGAPPEQGGRPAAGSLHEVLLALAGRIDDDALSSVRELVAVEDDAGAAELLSGCLLADAVALSGAERAVLEPWFAATRVDADLLELLPVDDAARDRHRHRFVAHASGGTGRDGHGDGRADVDAVARAAGRLSGVVSVSQCWRITPAGTSSGPLPHRVLLVATDPGADGEHVAHHVAYAARDLGAVSVEVLGAGTDLPAYHRNALDAATAVLGTAPGAVAGSAPPVARGSGDTVSEADMLLAELPYGGSDVPAPAAGGPDAPGATERPGEGPAEAPDGPVDAGVGTDPGVDQGPDGGPDLPLLDPDEAAARIAALWSTPAPVDRPEGGPTDVAPQDGEGPVPGLLDAGGPLEGDPLAAGADGVVPRGRTSRSPAEGAPEAVGAADGAPGTRVNGHDHGVNGHDHGVNGHDHGVNGHRPGGIDGLTYSGGAGPDDPPTDPVGWPFVAEDLPGPAADGRPDDAVPTGPTPLAAPAGPSAVDDPMPELSDRERDLLARLHAELAARERQDPDRADPFASPGAAGTGGAAAPAVDPAPPTTPLPLPGETPRGAAGAVDGQDPPRPGDGREERGPRP